MSWRKHQNNNADIKLIRPATNRDDRETQATLLAILANVCRNLPIMPLTVYQALSTHDITDWQCGQLTEETLLAFANALLQRQKMQAGQCPTHYRFVATCKQCGEINLWQPGDVLGCPWCFNRCAKQPIPRPKSVCCKECIYFQRHQHNHLGHCKQGEPESAFGLWDDTTRQCIKYIPRSL